MKKFFLIPLMTLVCSVMAWGATRTAGTFAQLQDEIAAAAAGDVIELTADIAYPTNGTGLVNITKSITLDGKGHKLSGYGTANISVSSTQNWPVTLAVNYGGEASAALDVTIQNLHVSNKASGTRSYGLMAWDGVDKLTLKNDSIYLGQSTASYRQVICITGTDATPLNLKIEDSYIGTSARSGYPAYILKPINATLKNTEFNGYCGLYFKYRMTGAYGTVVGTRGSVINADACAFICPNQHTSPSNNFAVFPLEDDGITLNLNNCSFNASTLGDTYQRFLNLQYLTRESGFQPVNVKLTGDNTHLYNVTANTVVFNGFTVGQYEPAISEGTCARVDVAINFTIEAGTFTFNPSNVHWFTYSDNKTAVKPSVDYSDQSEGSGAITIDLTKYQINEVKQGDKTLYRVVPKINTSYNINENYETAVDGENPNTSFIVQDNAPVALVNNTTEAAYVQVKEDNTVLTVGKATADQTLVINNGLDVQDNAQVVVKSGSAIVIGEGGITTEKPENIVVEANQNGAASLLLDPTITVNQTPELTVKMTVPAEHAGYEMLGSDKYRHWHRFAMPVEHMAATWVKDPDVPTFLYGWNYSAQEWAQVGVTEMVPFAGYTLSPDKEISTNTAVTYTFKGQLLGNTNCTLNLNHHGYNFFGNSYTGYISILKLVDQIMGDAKIDGTVWMWDGEKYQGVGLEYLRQYENVPGMIESWKKEVAPMQTFVLRLTGEDFSSTDINYADAIWGNPRYDAAKTALNAPARRAEINDDAIIRMTIEANGQKESVVMIENSNYSDAYDRGYDAIKYMNENCFNTYVGVNGENYGTVATDNLDGKMLNIKTNNELAYSMTFDFVAGEEYALRDNLTGNVIAIEEGATYEFAAQPNSTVEGRFEIVAAAKMPTSIENTEVKANVKGIYTIMGQYLGEDFEVLPAGVYVVNGVKIVK